jgi:hypothetical protein
MELRKFIGHRYDASHEQSLFPVWVWKDGAFTEVRSLPPSSAAQ